MKGRNEIGATQGSITASWGVSGTSAAILAVMIVELKAISGELGASEEQQLRN
jgi:hypothetical protein